MAINKNNFKNPEGNYEAKNSLIDVLVDGVNTNEDNISLLVDRVPANVKISALRLSAGSQYWFPIANHQTMRLSFVSAATIACDVLVIRLAGDPVIHQLTEHNQIAITVGSSKANIGVKPNHNSAGFVMVADI